MKYTPVDMSKSGTHTHPLKNLHIAKADVAKTILNKMDKANKVVWPCTRDFIKDALEAHEHIANEEPGRVEQIEVKQTPTLETIAEDLNTVLAEQSEKVRKVFDQINAQLASIPKLIEQEKAVKYLNGMDIKELLAMKLKEQFPEMEHEIILESIKEYMKV